MCLSVADQVVVAADYSISAAEAQRETHYFMVLFVSELHMHALLSRKSSCFELRNLLLSNTRGMISK